MSDAASPEPAVAETARADNSLDRLLLRAGVAVFALSAVLLVIALPGTSNAVMMAALLTALLSGTLLAAVAIRRPTPPEGIDDDTALDG